MKIEDLKVGRVYRAKRPRGVHRLDGSYVNDRQILYISPFGESIQYDSPSVTFKAKYPIISTEKFLKWADKDITDSLPPNEWEKYNGTIYLRSTNCKDAIRFRKNGQWLDNFGYQGGLISRYSLKNPYKNPFDFTRVKI